MTLLLSTLNSFLLSHTLTNSSTSQHNFSSKSAIVTVRLQVSLFIYPHSLHTFAFSSLITHSIYRYLTIMIIGNSAKISLMLLLQKSRFTAYMLWAREVRPEITEKYPEMGETITASWNCSFPYCTIMFSNITILIHLVEIAIPANYLCL